jgi:REP element-mobilizing transposase RayT
MRNESGNITWCLSQAPAQGAVQYLRRHLGEVFRKLAEQKESQIEGAQMRALIPLEYAVSQVVGFIVGKSAIHVARVNGERKRNFVRQHLWVRGYFVSTVGRDERMIRNISGSRIGKMSGWTG